MCHAEHRVQSNFQTLDNGVPVEEQMRQEGQAILKAQFFRNKDGALFMTWQGRSKPRWKENSYVKLSRSTVDQCTKHQLSIAKKSADSSLPTPAGFRGALDTGTDWRGTGAQPSWSTAGWASGTGYRAHTG